MTAGGCAASPRWPGQDRAPPSQGAGAALLPGLIPHTLGKDRQGFTSRTDKALLRNEV